MPNYKQMIQAEAKRLGFAYCGFSKVKNLAQDRQVNPYRSRREPTRNSENILVKTWNLIVVLLYFLGETFCTGVNCYKTTTGLHVNTATNRDRCNV